MKKLAFLFLLFIARLSAFAQTDSIPSPFSLWLSGGWGVSLSNQLRDTWGVRYGLNIALHQKHFISASIQSNLDIRAEWVDTKPEPNRLQELHNVSLLYGRGKYISESVAVIYSTGISFGKGEYRGNQIGTTTTGGGFFPPDTYPIFKQDRFNYIGLPMSVKFLGTGPIFGVSFDVYGNLHRHADFGCIASFELGKIRYNPTLTKR